ncbi:MAG TPA: ATP-binding protein [Alphaproteobacteria bacterium]|nr:ATP-binding protein [Alphaproteobacteria bacterium]
MPAKDLDAAAVGLPAFDVPPMDESAPSADPFALSSHQRARRALEFGLGIEEAGFNIFVLGESRSGRMTATLDYLRKRVVAKPAPADWIYVANFKKPHRPRPYRLPAGQGRVLRDRMRTLASELKEVLKRTLESAEYVGESRRLSDSIKGPIAAEFEEIRRYALGLGLDIQATSQGMMMMIAGQGGQPRSAEELSPEEREQVRKSMAQVDERLQAFRHGAQLAEARLSEALRQARRNFADGVAAPLIDSVAGDYPMLSRWFVELREDVLDSLDAILAEDAGGAARDMNGPTEERYSINLMADHADDRHPEVVLEPLPTYANLLGSIEYKLVGGALQTNFSMIRPGALHRANGGILVLRAEAIVDERDAWTLLKGALRDREIRIDEPHRQGNVPMAQSPKPKPIPLDVKVVIVGAPHWYYNHFASDPDFPVHFKVKADIDSEMDATAGNIVTFAHLVRDSARRIGVDCETDAVGYVLGQSARWAGHREKLSGRFELIDDLLSEATALMRQAGDHCLTAEHIRTAIAERRRRNSLVEDRVHDSIRRGSILIDVSGTIVGQVNGLTVRDLGDHAFGLPSRITARTSVGKLGIVNIERATLMGGPIQQKGVMVLEGFLAGRFARRFPLSFSASITFEQNYGGVEGDSASLAELCAVLSDLADLPVRQDIALTGSINQLGQVQAVGGVHQKVEGFFRACKDRGPLTGSQGVIVPAANELNLTLRDEVQRAIADDVFHVWSVAHVGEAVELLTGIPSGADAKEGKYPARSVYGRVLARLAEHDRILTERVVLRG